MQKINLATLSAVQLMPRIINKFPRLYTELFLETLCKIRRIIKTYHIADFINTVFIFRKQGCRFLQPHYLYQFIRSNISQRLDLGKQTGTADTKLFSQKINCQFRFREVLFDKLKKRGQEFIVHRVAGYAVQRHHRHFRKLLAEQITQVEKILDTCLQILY